METYEGSQIQKLLPIYYFQTSTLNHPNKYNTFDKKTLLNNPHPQYVKVSDKKVEDFVKERELFDFFMKD